MILSFGHGHSNPVWNLDANVQPGRRDTKERRRVINTFFGQLKSIFHPRRERIQASGCLVRSLCDVSRDPDGHYSERSITRHEVPCTCSRTISTVGRIVWNLGSCPCKLKNGRKLLPEAIWVDLSSPTPNGFTIALLHKKIQRPHFFPWAINHSVAMLIRSQGTQETHIPSS